MLASSGCGYGLCGLHYNQLRHVALEMGVQVQAGNRLLNRFEQTQKMMKQFSKWGMGTLMRGMKGMMPGMR